MKPSAYADPSGYEPANLPLIFDTPGVGDTVLEPNLWQPLAFDQLILQNGLVIGASVQEFLGPHWGQVRPFAITRASESDVYRDPGPPPYLLDPETDAAFKDAALEVIEFASWLDPTDEVRIDVSPRSRHNNTLGTNDGSGYELNPYTGEPYEENLVLRADYGRILAEFWADGPDSETPPGHWNSVAHAVTDHDLFSAAWGGEGDPLPALEWDVKLYFALNAALHDAAIACWDAKRKYDYVRPITMIRYMGGKGQSSDPDLPSYHEAGLPLREGLVELITGDSTAAGARHAHLAGHEGKIAVYSWLGIPDNPNEEIGGVGWLLAEEWMPYQRDTFVTPPFGAYTSGHSTFSRAAAEVLAAATGDPYFPGGISSFTAPAHEFLEFENGPEESITLSWATYFDAADEAGISRLYGGIHVWADDLRGRIMGSEIGQLAFSRANKYFDGTATPMDWPLLYQEWLTALPGESGVVSGDPDEVLSHFFHGPNLRAGAFDSLALDATYDSTRATMRVAFALPYSLLPPGATLETSRDLVNWEALPPGAILEKRDVREGWLEIILEDATIGSNFGNRYYRVRLTRE
jgi:hypothetical protein